MQLLFPFHPEVTRNILGVCGCKQFHQILKQSVDFLRQTVELPLLVLSPLELLYEGAFVVTLECRAYDIPIGSLSLGVQIEGLLCSSVSRASQWFLKVFDRCSAPQKGNTVWPEIPYAFLISTPDYAVMFEALGALRTRKVED